MEKKIGEGWPQEMTAQEMKPTVLSGSSWDHPRGHAPMLATAAEYEAARKGSVVISWVPRALKEFGTMSVDSLARQFDLMVIDHPHVGAMAESGCAVALDEVLEPQDLDALARHSPGRSHESYQYEGHQWALAIDAACQTSAWRPDLIERPPATWAEVLELAESGRVLWPLCDVDAAASFFTLTATSGAPCATGGRRLVDRDVGQWALGTMRSVAERSDTKCLSSNPIDVLELIARSDNFVYVPLVFCYVYYSLESSPAQRVMFGDIPATTPGQAPVGSLLGGAGLAVSTYSSAVPEAVRYCLYVASPSTQRGTYLSSGGQPAHGDAWLDTELDRRTRGFFSRVGRTMQGAWTRPREPSFAGFQNDMFELFKGWFAAAAEPEAFLDRLDELYAASI